MALRHYSHIWPSPHKHACAHPENEISLFCCDLNPLVAVFSPQCLIGGNCDQLSSPRSLLNIMDVEKKGDGDGTRLFLVSFVCVLVCGWGWVGEIKSGGKKRTLDMMNGGTWNTLALQQGGITCKEHGARRKVLRASSFVVQFSSIWSICASTKTPRSRCSNVVWVGLVSASPEHMIKTITLTPARRGTQASVKKAFPHTSAWSGALKWADLDASRGEKCVV